MSGGCLVVTTLSLSSSLPLLAITNPPCSAVSLRYLSYLYYIATKYGHESHGTQFQTRSLLFFHSRQAPLDDRLSQPLYQNSCQVVNNSATTRKCRAHVQSAIGRRVSTNSLPLLLRLDLGPRPQVFDSPPVTIFF